MYRETIINKVLHVTTSNGWQPASKESLTARVVDIKFEMQQAYDTFIMDSDRAYQFEMEAKSADHVFMWEQKKQAYKYCAETLFIRCSCAHIHLDARKTQHELYIAEQRKEEMQGEKMETV